MGYNYKKIYIKTGIIVSLIIVILFFGINFLKGKGFFNNQYYYYAIYDKIDGLNISNSVLINGFKVGQVSNIQFTDDRSGRLVVEIAVDKKYRLPKVSTARIFSSDLMGTKSISLVYGKENQMHNNKDTLISDFEGSLTEMVSIEMLPLKNKAEDLMKELENIMIVVSQILNEQGKKNIEASLKSIKETFNNLATSSSNLDSIMNGGKNKIENILGNIEGITENLNKNNEQITLLLQNISSISDSVAQSNIKQLINDMGGVINSLDFVGQKIQKGEGSLGRLVHSDTLYSNLQDVTYNLNSLLQDLKENPKRYVRFSAFDFGKTIYVTDTNIVNKKRGKVIFKIKILSSNKNILLKPENFKGYKNVEENSLNGIYSYTYGRFKNIEKAKIKLKEVRRDFPNAVLLQFFGGTYKEVK